MMQPVYISAAAALSPQHSFDNENLLQPLVNSDDGKLYVQDTDYTKFISPVAIRRMSRMLKIGISTGMRCMQLSGITTPDGIITGTGRGSMRDMEIFLGDMIRLEEGTLNPTYFIQSTYNSVNGWLAMQTKCTGYNQTYVHRGHSLEMALLDAQMLLNETTENKTYLVGALDEMTDEYFLVKNKKGYWKREIPNSLDLLKDASTPGSIGGEGAAFFTVTNQKENSLATISGIKMLQAPSTTDVDQSVAQLLADNNLSYNDIDIVFAGMSGDSRFQHLYSGLDTFGDNTTIAAFKHLCGEYDTSSGFAIWLAVQALQQQSVPDVTVIKRGTNKSVKNILLINHYILNSASVILLQA